jgi:CO/xanthine dehydrogenase Mo-binding subunit
MNKLTSMNVSRRQFLKGAGALVISSVAVSEPAGRALAQTAGVGTGATASIKPPLLPSQLDSYLAIGAEGRVTGFFGKIDMGQGVETGIAQIIAEELDVSFDSVSLVMCDTAVTIDAGGASNSMGIRHGGIMMRNAAAEARRVLLELASARLGVAADALAVSDGVVRVQADPSRAVTYAALIGSKYFNVTLEWNKQLGFALDIKGKAKPKPASQYKLVGKPYPAVEVPGKVFGRTRYVTDMRRPGMLHARMIRPPVAGAVPVSVDAASIRALRGARVVQVKDLIAVVAPDEWNAVRAARQLKVKWSDVKPPFPDMASLYDHLRRAPTVGENAGDLFGGKVAVNEGPVEAAFAKAARIVEREYEHPFQSHACMGPACALAEIADGKVTVWTGSQKAHSVREGVAAILGVALESVRAVWMPSPGSYGRNEAGDAALEAAVLARETGRPVRVQWMRHEGTGWDPKGPAGVMQMKAGLDAAGNVIAYRFKARAFSSWDVSSRESDPSDTLPGMLLGAPIKSQQNFGVPSNAYQFPVALAYWQSVAPLLDRASPLRTAHLRDPQGPQCQFASESFMDELAFELGVDPVEFRLRHIKSPRDAAVIRAAAQKAGWEARTRPRMQRRGGMLVGQGIGYATRQGTIVATIAEVEIDPKSGRPWARKFTVAHDCGLIVNPALLKKTIEGNIVMATSRALFEEVKFDNRNVTSLDWASYPILETPDVPEDIDIVLIDRPESPSTGAGEPSTRQVAPAIANAIFDATGTRLRRLPFTPERIKGLLG